MQDGKYVILCVDDDPDVLQYLQIILEGNEYVAAKARSAEEGLRVYKTARPDALIVDLMMEEVDAGITLVTELRALGNKGPIFMLSSTGDNLSRTIDTTTLGLAGVFQKPLDSDMLLRLLKSRLKKI